jgi:hypothetical protein
METLCGALLGVLIVDHLSFLGSGGKRDKGEGCYKYSIFHNSLFSKDNQSARMLHISWTGSDSTKLQTGPKTPIFVACSSGCFLAGRAGRLRNTRRT